MEWGASEFSRSGGAPYAPRNRRLLGVEIGLAARDQRGQRPKRAPRTTRGRFTHDYAKGLLAAPEDCEPAVRRRRSREDDAHIIRKPLSEEELASKVRLALADSTSTKVVPLRG